MPAWKRYIVNTHDIKSVKARSSFEAEKRIRKLCKKPLSVRIYMEKCSSNNWSRFIINDILIVKARNEDEARSYSKNLEALVFALPYNIKLVNEIRQGK